ncbi:hypothetical protein DL93DRAFT_2054844 [Clavulina sp. PMI_390]|nr:hypothetical protein DL93DRAFT_2054844 [Clavulina sp. PMI_390]
MESSSSLSDLPSHPIFKAPNGYEKRLVSLESLQSLGGSRGSTSSKENGLFASGSKLVFRGPDIILAVGNELRISALGHDLSSSGSSRQYKTLHTPNVQFEISSISLAPGGKMLAIAGSHQVAVVVLPRPSYHKLVNPRVDCKAIQVGQYYHATTGSSRIAKIDWHPWGDGGSSLLVLTSDTVLREYDISRDTDEPQQTATFVPPKGKSQYTDEDPNAREAVSFCVGKGTVDWSPLTVYGLMRNGDVYGVCPFLPSSASIPRAYLSGLEFFVASKREIIERGISSFIPSHHPPSSPFPNDSFTEQENEELAVMNDQQLKYVHALTKQMLREAGSEVSSPADSSTSRSRNKTHVTVQPPKSTKYAVSRQGPFLLQPAPPELDGGLDDEPEACDIVYLEIGDAQGEERAPQNEEVVNEKEKLGVVVVVYQDGRVDLCLDIEKIEAQWDVNVMPPSDLPSFTVYESIDLGLIDSLSATGLLPLLGANRMAFHVDPLYPGRVVVSHAFGVHLIDMRKCMRSLFEAMQDEVTVRVGEGAKEAGGSEITHLLNTFSAEDKATAPVIGLSIVDNAFISYSLVAVTSQYQAIPLGLHVRPELSSSARPSTSIPSDHKKAPSPQQSRAYISILEKEPFSIPTFTPRRAAASLPPLNPASSGLGQSRAQPAITPQVLRSLGSRVEALRADMRDISPSAPSSQPQPQLQQQQQSKNAFSAFFPKSTPSPPTPPAPAPSSQPLLDRVTTITNTQNALNKRLDTVLQRLMDAHAIESESGLSDFEKAWFGELGRMRREVGGRIGDGGEDEQDGRSLWSRTQLLKHQIEILTPQLEEIKKKEAERKRPRRAPHAPAGLGSAQLRSVQRRLAQEWVPPLFYYTFVLGG